MRRTQPRSGPVGPPDGDDRDHTEANAPPADPVAAEPPDADPEPTPPSSLTRLLDLAATLWRPALLLGAVVALWWLVTAREMVAPYLIPAPGSVVESLVTEWEMLLRHTWITLSATLWGFLWATVLGLATAILIVYSTTLARTIYPLILIAQVIPKIAIAPILVVWLGLGSAPKIVLAVLIAFFPVVISAVAGLRSVDPEHLDLAATMGAGRVRTFLKVRFPGSLPHLFSGLKVAVTLAVVGAVVGEFVGANEGLGYLLLLASGSLNTPLLFADLILMSLIGIVLFAIVEIAERVFMPWHASQRTDLVTS